jgi:hypothetical protein
VQLALVIATLLLGHLLSKRGVTWIGEAGIALLLGAGFGLLLEGLGITGDSAGASTYAEVRGGAELDDCVQGSGVSLHAAAARPFAACLCCLARSSSTFERSSSCWRCCRPSCLTRAGGAGRVAVQRCNASKHKQLAQRTRGRPGDWRCTLRCRLDANSFFANLDGILALAFAGTLLSSAAMGAVVWGGGALGLCAPLSPLHAGLFGAVVSATDPVRSSALVGWHSFGCLPWVGRASGGLPMPACLCRLPYNPPPKLSSECC